MTFNPILSGIVYEEQQNNSKPFWNPAIRMNLHLQYLNINLDEVTLCIYYQLWHPACYSCYTPGIKSLMRNKRTGSYYDKRNMSVVICDTDTPYRFTKSWLIWTLCSVASLLAATIYHGNLDWNHKLWNIGSADRYILHTGDFVTYKLKIHSGKIEIIVNFVFNRSSLSITRFWSRY